MDRECKKKRALSRFFHCSFFSSLCIFFSCLPLSESLKLANFDQIQVAFKHWCYLNGEWGRKNEHGEGGNEKWEQSRELEMKLLIGLRFKAGFVPICHFPIPRARPLLHFPRFSDILLNTISQLDRVIGWISVIGWRFAFSDSETPDSLYCNNVIINIKMQKQISQTDIFISRPGPFWTSYFTGPLSTALPLFSSIEALLCDNPYCFPS